MNPSLPTGYLQSLADRGAYLEYDMISMSYYYPEEDAQCPSDAEEFRGHPAPFEADAEERSSFHMTYSSEHAHPLRRAWIWIHPASFRSHLKRLGLEDRDIEQLLVANPRRYALAAANNLKEIFHAEKKKILLVGGSGSISSASHAKGFDQFFTTTAHNGAVNFLKAMRDTPYEVIHMPSEVAQSQFPATVEGLAGMPPSSSQISG
jgi:hypothetical protein